MKQPTAGTDKTRIETFRDLAAAIDAVGGSPFDFRAVGAVLDGLSPGDVSALLRGLLREIKEKGRLPTQTEDHIYLHRQPDFSVLLRFAGTGTTTAPLSANEYDAYLLNLSSDDVSIPAYSCGVAAGDTGRRPPPLRREAAPFVLPPNGLRFAPAFGAVLDLPAAAPVAPVIVVHSDRRAWSTWTFDRATLQPLQRVSTDLQASRIQLALKVLEAMEVEGLGETLDRLATSDLAGFVRWDAVKSLYGSDPARARRLLERMADRDADPELRRAARTTLRPSTPGA